MTTRDTQRGQTAERDWPAGHPSAPDYKGEAYVPPPAPFSEDWPKGHPSRAGKNVPKNWRGEEPVPAPEAPAEAPQERHDLQPLG